MTVEATEVERADGEQSRSGLDYARLQAFLDAGHTQREAAAHYGVSRAKVQRLLAAGADSRGDTERSVAALVNGWGDDPTTQVKAALLTALARVVDRASTSSTASAALAATAAAAELRKLLEAVEQAGRADREWLLGVFAAPGDFDTGGGAE